MDYLAELFTILTTILYFSLHQYRKYIIRLLLLSLCVYFAIANQILFFIISASTIIMIEFYVYLKINRKTVESNKNRIIKTSLVITSVLLLLVLAMSFNKPELVNDYQSLHASAFDNLVFEKVSWSPPLIIIFCYLVLKIHRKGTLK